MTQLIVAFRNFANAPKIMSADVTTSPGNLAQDSFITVIEKKREDG
jgi:hypothetical protein